MEYFFYHNDGFWGKHNYWEVIPPPSSNVNVPYNCPSNHSASANLCAPSIGLFSNTMK